MSNTLRLKVEKSKRAQVRSRRLELHRHALDGIGRLAVDQVVPEHVPLVEDAGHSAHMHTRLGGDLRVAPPLATSGDHE